MAEADGDARVGLLLESLGGMVAHFDHLRSRHDVETVGRAALLCEYLQDAIPVAEKHDPAVASHLLECHDGAADGSLGSEIPAHGINPYP